MANHATVIVLYPSKEGAKFDLDYYTSTHMVLAEKTWKPHGLLSWKVMTFAEGPYSVGAEVAFESLAAFQKAMQAPDAKVVADDVKNFSSVEPVFVVGEDVKTG
ncbi:hypothetical protein CC80DRAFT_440824 [Byssothecium circinans]|uniref:EthD domain-containing protein n=1 Tax=Byssothecium circinans TaxID=147558 RepID=A0A6A5U368_9PLEO|nr:hypothetical protein CC80DRAFT_440824 [Byssothecium circinans]